MQVINTMNHYLVKFISFQGYTIGRRQPCQVGNSLIKLFQNEKALYSYN